MTKLKLFADSACDLSLGELAKLDIELMPLTITFSESSYKDVIELDSMRMIDEMKRTGEIPKTSAPSPSEFGRAFLPYVEKGIPILYVGLGSELSSTVANARTAAAEFPSGAVSVVDSFNVSGPIGGLLRMAHNMMGKNVSVEEIVATLTKRAPNFRLFFTVDKLDALRKSGRCSNLSYIVGSMLGIKPILRVTNEGISMWKKARGIPRALEVIAEEVAKDVGHILHSEVHIASVQKDSEDRAMLKKMLKKVAGIKNFYEYDISCTVASHCGITAFGFGYFVE